MKQDPSNKVSIETPSNPKPDNKKTKNKGNEVVLGFILVYVMNSILSWLKNFLYNVLPPDYIHTSAGNSTVVFSPIIDWIPITVNIGVIIYLLLKRPLMALGMLVGILLFVAVGYWINTQIN